MNQLVDIIKHIETGRKYIIPNGDPLPSNAYTRIRIGISEDEATTIVRGVKLKNKC